jgi:hypothetical protein
LVQERYSSAFALWVVFSPFFRIETAGSLDRLERSEAASRFVRKAPRITVFLPGFRHIFT